MLGVTKVIIGCSTWTSYQFLLPASALLWRERIGFDPFLFLTGNWVEKERSHVMLRALDGFGFEYQFLPDQPNVSEATLAQNCRQHAAVLPVPEGTWLMPSDADLWPIRKEFYQAHLSAQEPWTAYYANGDHYQSYPTCHVAAKASTWRKAYGYPPDGEVGVETAKSLEAWVATSPMYAAQPNKAFGVWCSDQWMMTEKMKASGLAIKHIERRGHPPVDRIDREGLPENWRDADVSKYTDAHVHKCPYEDTPLPGRVGETEGRWTQTARLFARLLPQHDQWFREYRERYIRGL